MAEYAAVPSCMKLDMLRISIKERGLIPRDSYFKVVQRKCSYGSYKVARLSSWQICVSTAPVVSNLKITHCSKEGSLRCSCLADGATTSDWVPVVDQVLLMASIFLTYMAGVIPTEKSYFSSQRNVSDDNAVHESSTFSGSALKNGDQVNLKCAWDVVKGKLLDSLNAIEHIGSLENGVVESEQRAKRPLSLHAIADGPRLRLLWASFQQLEKEVENISENSETVTMDDWLILFSEIIQKLCQPICMAWLEKECTENRKADKALHTLMFEKLEGDTSILQKIRNSGKEDLFAELLCFLRFGSLREGCCYDHSLFTLHGVVILEDLVITLADGISSVYLELISVDGNVSNEMNSLGWSLCTLSTRALQRLRNEVALKQWLYQNMEAVVSMYEDCFDLCTLQSQLIEEPSKSQAENFSWWKKLTVRQSGSLSTPSHCVVISHFSMPVKRTKELRALTGWRYYFSLFLELSDITMPLIRAIFTKVSDAVSFFLVCLIGRSLGLIYTGIRQSLRWN